MADLLEVFPTLMDTLKQVPKVNKQFRYGTAGFRADGEDLDNVFARCAIVASLRSMYTKQVRILSPFGVNLLPFFSF